MAKPLLAIIFLAAVAIALLPSHLDRFDLKGRVASWFGC